MTAISLFKSTVLFALIFFSFSAVSKTPEVFFEDSFYPEGPLVIPGQGKNSPDIYHVQWAPSDDSKTDTGADLSAPIATSKVFKNHEVFFESRECGPAGIIRTNGSMGMASKTKDHYFLVTCYNSHKILKLDLLGKVVFEYSDPKLKGPNDLVQTPYGVVISGSNQFLLSDNGELLPDNKGTLFLLANENLTKIAEGLDYPNGVAYIADEKQLLVSEHFANQVSSFKFIDDGKGFSLGKKHRFRKLPDVDDGNLFPIHNRYFGPDGLHYDSISKSLYVAHFGNGKVFEYNLREGKAKGQFRTYNTKLKYPTNVFKYWDPTTGRYRIAVTAVENAMDATGPYFGKVLLVDVNDFK